MLIKTTKTDESCHVEPLPITHWLETAAAFFEAQALPAWAVTGGSVILAFVLSQLIKRRIQALSPISRYKTTLEFLSPFLQPMLNLGLMLAALYYFKHQGLESELLTLLAKVAASWFAIMLIRQMIVYRIAGWFVALALIPITILRLFDLLDETILLLSDIKFSLGSANLNAYAITKAIIALMALQWLASISVRLVDNRLQNIHDLRASNRALIIKLFSILIYCFIFLFAMQVIGINLTALGVFGGALGVGLGFGLQKIASNFISGIILLFEKSIEIGDLIELADGTLGYVRQTYARYTRLEMATGKEVLIPNEEFISQRVISWTHSHKKAQIEIVVNISYDSDVALARKLMTQAAEEYKGRLPNSETVCFLTNFGDSGLELRLQFWLRDVTLGRMEPKSDVMLVIWEAFRAHNIIIAYPQRQVRVTNNTSLDETTLLGADA